MNPNLEISIVIASKRRERGAVQAPRGYTVISIDRSNPVLGNRHYLQNHNDAAERAQVVGKHDQDVQADKKVNGPITRELRKIAERVKNGEKVALLCWCATEPTPRQCHGDTYKREIIQMIQEEPAATAQ